MFVRRALPWLSALAVLAIVSLAVVLPADAPSTYRGGLVLVAVLSAIAIAGAVDSRLGRVLDWGPLRWIGVRSYGLYLWHWPVWVLVTAALPVLVRVDTGWMPGAIALVITVILAAASFHFVEEPIHRSGFGATLRRWVGRRPRSAARRATIACAGLIVLALLGTTGVAIASDPGTTDAQAVIEHGRRSVAPERPEPGPTAATPPPLPGGDQIDAIGDSVMLASAPELQAGFPGIQIDAVVSRQLSSAPAIVQGMRDSGTLRPVLLIGLGTNGPIDRQSLEQIRSIAGPRHEIVVVNVQAPRGWTDGVNDTLTRFALQYRSVELANWRDAITPRLDLLARDQIHPGAAGGLIYVRAVTDALQRLAELPPSRSPNDYGLAGTPL
jgi:hypothetical protein